MVQVIAPQDRRLTGGRNVDLPRLRRHAIGDLAQRRLRSDQPLKALSLLLRHRPRQQQRAVGSRQCSAERRKLGDPGLAVLRIEQHKRQRLRAARHGGRRHIVAVRYHSKTTPKDLQWI